MGSHWWLWLIILLLMIIKQEHEFSDSYLTSCRNLFSKKNKLRFSMSRLMYHICLILSQEQLGSLVFHLWSFVSLLRPSRFPSPWSPQISLPLHLSWVDPAPHRSDWRKIKLTQFSFNLYLHLEQRKWKKTTTTTTKNHINSITIKKIMKKPLKLFLLGNII